MKNVWTVGHSNRDTASFISGENAILNGSREPPLTVDILGCRLGQFGRECSLTPDDFEMLVAAQKGA